jgi:hypothetical protein
MKLIYWIAIPTDDVEGLAIRAKTKKELLAILEHCKQVGCVTTFDAPKKVVAEYADGFDLMMQCVDGVTLASFE